MKHTITAVAAALALPAAMGLAWSGYTLAAGAAQSPKLYDSSVGGIVTAPPGSKLASQGYLVYEKWCAGCHAPNPARQKNGGGLVGRVYAGTYILQQKYKGSEPAALAQRKDLTPGEIRDRVRHGYNIMPRFRITEISDADLQAVIAYLTRNNPK